MSALIENKNKQNIIDRLLMLDEEVSLALDDDNTYYEMVIVGGGALVLIDKLTRATQDIDTIRCAEEIKPFLEKYDINSNVVAYVNNFVFDYLDRCIPVDIPTKKIKFYTASLEDIVISKLCSERPKDKVDIHNFEIIKALDWNMLDKLVKSEDFKDNFLNEHNYKMFLFNYRDYCDYRLEVLK